MNISKKIMVLSLATVLTVSPIMANANSEKEVINVKSTEEALVEKYELEYIKYTGKIVERDENQSNSILVKDNEEDLMNGEVYHINENVIILDGKTKNIVNRDELKVGITVTTYTHKNTPVALSLPAQRTPDVIVINEDEDSGFIEVSKFDEELVNAENKLKLLISEDTIIVDEAGEKVEKEDLANKDLIVFYTESTRSIPAQTTAEKIIILNEEEEVMIDERDETEVVEEEIQEIRVIDMLEINNKEINLEKEVYGNEEGVVMIPLRQIAEELGYEVKWNNETRSVELTKDVQWTSVTIGEDSYNFAKMIIKLGAAPELKEATTFVPLTFLEEVLKVNINITEAGIINIVE